MKTKFYDSFGLEGHYIELGYGYHTYDQFDSKINEIRSINIPPHVSVTLFSHDKFKGASKIIANHGNKFLKIVNLLEIFRYDVQSITIECACHLENRVIHSNNFKMDVNIISKDDQKIGYSLYKVILGDDGDQIMFIIPDFGYNKSIYENFQKRLTSMNISSLILDYPGTGLSQPSKDMQYSEIILDYKFVANKLHLFQKRKPILFGHGLGGAIAQLWALTYKRELSYLILVDSAPYSVYSTYSLINNYTLSWLENKITTEEYAEVIVNGTFNVSGKDCDIEKLKIDLKNSIIKSDTTSLKNLLLQNPIDNNLALAPKFINVPTLIVHGINDNITSIGGSNALYALLPPIDRTIFRKIKTGHSPQLTTPHSLLEIIHKFLSPSKKSNCANQDND